jgi:3-hydroxyacyl-CoA dehydrogenase
LSINICIAGSGKIARDAGRFFLKKGHAVCWVSAGENRLVELQAWINKHVQSFMKHSGGAVRELSASFALYDELKNESFDVVFECRRESLDVKQEAFARLADRCAAGCLAFSSSSSILPSAIVKGCLGLHVFYPLELTGLAELVVPADLPGSTCDTAIAFCEENGIACIVQDEANAFAVNRLLLPLQNELFTALERGVSYADADAASASPLCRLGMCEFARKVGPAVVAAAVANYCSRMAAPASAQFEALSRGLAGFNGSIGRWKSGRKLDGRESDELSTTLYYLFINTCLQFVEHQEISTADLNLVMDSVLGADVTLEQAIAREGKTRIAEALVKIRAQGALSYFEPSALLELGTATAAGKTA